MTYFPTIHLHTKPKVSDNWSVPGQALALQTRSDRHDVLAGVRRWAWRGRAMRQMVRKASAWPAYVRPRICMRRRTVSSG